MLFVCVVVGVWCNVALDENPGEGKGFRRNTIIGFDDFVGACDTQCRIEKIERRLDNLEKIESGRIRANLQMRENNFHTNEDHVRFAPPE